MFPPTRTMAHFAGKCLQKEKQELAGQRNRRLPGLNPGAPSG